MIRRWLVEPLTTDVQRVIDKLAREEDVYAIAVMPDVHLAAEVCVGTVIASRSTVYPSADGSDIGCGMAALKFDANRAALDLQSVLRQIGAAVPTQRRYQRAALDLPESPMSEIAEWQLGTLGGGNHFLELQEAEDGSVWAMVHTGSRGVGAAVRDYHLRHAERSNGGFAVLRGSQIDHYLRDMEWALQFAMRNRKAVLDQLTHILDSQHGIRAVEGSLIQCHHNWVQREMHEGHSLFVHRKGAISARTDELGIIPGSMGAASHHVMGRGCTASLCSSSHGAGRRMSRSAARTTISSHKLAQQMRGVVYDERLSDKLRDEAPRAYKDIRAVMRAQTELTRIVRALRPLLSYKGV